ncbi:glycoside hydrolase family 108 protein [Polaribacter aestuariivivens]|uniref:glycoside hydrolase family 108 protein n=1 Tax=Polaribacter aestuariivivens TaxID=2304626 RepID=UPI003F491FA2
MANYYDFKETVQQLEGGFQKIPSDPGNYNSRKELVGTNHGISAPVYESWIGYPPSEIDMRAMSKTIASEIFKTNYWNKLRASEIKNQAVAENLVDHGVNAGTGAATKIMQRVLNKYFNKNLSVDGGLGPITLAAINSVNPLTLFQKYSQYRFEYYSKINNPDWAKIWDNRVFSLAKKFGIVVKKKA